MCSLAWLWWSFHNVLCTLNMYINMYDKYIKQRIKFVKRKDRYILLLLFNYQIVSDSAIPRLQHARLPCLRLSPGIYSNSWPLSQWCHSTTSSSVIPFSSCLQSFPASGSIPMSQFFTSGSESIGISASASVLAVNIQNWFPLGWIVLILLLSRGLLSIFSSTTIKKHQSSVVSLLYGPTVTSICD